MKALQTHNAKPSEEPLDKLANLNKQILEIKKKIQLSEGQRKAAFEVFDAQKTANEAEIAKLRKRISDAVLKVKERRCVSAKTFIPKSNLEGITYVGHKTAEETVAILDLQIIDKSKQLDLLRYQIKKKQRYLKQLADEYQTLASGKLKKQAGKANSSTKKKIRELQNDIHAVQVQWKEADHVRDMYRNVRKSLSDDAARFGSNIKKIEEEIQAQYADIEGLQKINAEAAKMRCMAKNVLVKEERTALKSGTLREKQAAEGKRLIVERQLELEKLERRMLQAGKTHLKPELDGDEDKSSTSTPTQIEPTEELCETFSSLKEVTGGTTTGDILARFRTQRDTFSRLCVLRKTGEEEKRKLEARRDLLANLTETLKFEQVKDAKENAEELEKHKEQINSLISQGRNCDEQTAKINSDIEALTKKAQDILLSIDPSCDVLENPLKVFEKFEDEVREIMRRVPETNQNEVTVQNNEVEEEKWLPSSYSVIRRTPLPQQGTSTTPIPPAGSDDDEEVPSRNYMKRQAQIVIDAKSRRKNMRFQIKK